MSHSCIQERHDIGYYIIFSRTIPQSNMLPTASFIEISLIMRNCMRVLLTWTIPLNNHNFTDVAVRWFPSVPLHTAVAAVAWRGRIGCWAGFAEKSRWCLKGVMTAFPVVEPPLILPVITTSFTVAELLVLSTVKRNHVTLTETTVTILNFIQDLWFIYGCTHIDRCSG